MKKSSFVVAQFGDPDGEDVPILAFIRGVSEDTFYWTNGPIDIRDVLAFRDVEEFPIWMLTNIRTNLEASAASICYADLADVLPGSRIPFACLRDDKTRA